MAQTFVIDLPNLTTRTSGPMDDAQRAHLERIQKRIAHDLAQKYEDGQVHHGGNLWEKPGMLEAAIEECLDLCTYLYTLLEQRERGFAHNGRDE